jgi:hypothetical protein
MFRQAAERWAVDFPRSYVIGDAMADVQAAQTIGSTAILVLTGRGEDQHDLLLENNHSGYYVANDLWDAVEWIWQRKYPRMRRIARGLVWLQVPFLSFVYIYFILSDQLPLIALVFMGLIWAAYGSRVKSQSAHQSICQF